MLGNVRLYKRYTASSKFYFKTSKPATLSQVPVANDIVIPHNVTEMSHNIGCFTCCRATLDAKSWSLLLRSRSIPKLRFLPSVLVYSPSN